MRILTEQEWNWRHGIFYGVCKDFWKPSKPCPVGIHWIAIAEYSQMSTHVPGFQIFQSFFMFFCIIWLGHRSQQWINWYTLLAANRLFFFMSVQMHQRAIDTGEELPQANYHTCNQIRPNVQPQCYSWLFSTSSVNNVALLKDRAEEKRAWLLASSRVHQLIPCCDQQRSSGDEM